jgi:hypothetical protein
MYKEDELPHYDGTPQWITKEWTTNATDTQLAMIDNGNVKVSKGGVCTLPEIYDSELGAKVSHYVCRHGDYPTKIVNMAGLYTTGILGVNILRTCTKFRDEGAPVLYGGNSFVMGTRGQSPFKNHRGVHEFDSLNAHCDLVPGLPTEDGTPHSRRQTLSALNFMFENRSSHQPFMRRDPLATFLRTIGRTNASYITNITIEGHFKTAENDWRYRNNRPITFAHILPIHFTILAHATPNFTKLAIYQGYNNALWEDDLDGQLGLSDEERYDEVVRNLVNDIPGLESLHLANYSFKAPEEIEGGNEEAEAKQRKRMARPCGKALRWEGIVDDRYKQRKKELRLRAERETKKMQLDELDQYMWKENRGATRGSRNSRRDQRRGGFQNRAPGNDLSSNAERYNASFAALVDNAAAAAENDGAGSSGGRPSFKRGKKLARGRK